jgi:hypothetical protein
VEACRRYRFRFGSDWRVMVLERRTAVVDGGGGRADDCAGGTMQRWVWMFSVGVTMTRSSIYRRFMGGR